MPANAVLFNQGAGFVEALLRGYRLGFLTEAEFQHVAQCENLEDVKLNLQETDYGNFLQEDPSPISPSTVRDRAMQKLVTEFEYLRANADAELAEFLEYIRIDFMIDNVMLVLKATLNNPNVNVKELLEQVHPLGKLPEGALKSVVQFDNTPKGYAELYQTVLIDTPIGKYFSAFLSEVDPDKNEPTISSTGDVRNVLEELSTTKLENTLRKLYLEDFYTYVTKMGGETGELMRAMLEARADATAISITLNSFGTSLNDESMVDARASFFPCFGSLYPAATGPGGSLLRVHTEEELVEALRSYKDYANIMAKFVSGETTLDDAFYARETMMCELAFESQFNFACFYCYVRLKEQEIRNLVWCCETIVQKQKSKMGQHFIPIFSRNSPWRTGKM